MGKGNIQGGKYRERECIMGGKYIMGRGMYNGREIYNGAKYIMIYNL